jgi:hypothetical protein
MCAAARTRVARTWIPNREGETIMSHFRLLNPANVVILPATIVGNARYADWDGAAQASGAAGVAVEALQAAAGANAKPFFVPADSGWQINDIQALLLQHGIKLWGVGYWNNELYFRVKKRQAHWAQYVLLRADVPLLHGLVDGSRANPGYSQQAHSRSRGQGDSIGRLLDWVTGLLGQ